MSRFTDIISMVNIKLKQVSGLVVQQGEIIYASTQIQNRILRDTKCNEISFTITFTEDEESGEIPESFDISTHTPCLIKNIFPQWTGAEDIIYVPNANWDEYSKLTGSYPLYCTIFNNSIYFTPSPTVEDDTVIIWAYKSSVKTTEVMSSSVEPVIPSHLDYVLILGICSVFSEKFKEEFEYELSKASMLTHQKIGEKTSRSNW